MQGFVVHTLFVTATGTSVGKTYTTLKLIEAFANRSIKVGVCKPIETGVADIPLDAETLLEACRSTNPAFSALQPADITAYTFPLPAAPYCADLQKTINIEAILQKVREMDSLCDLLLIEGAGGLMVPIQKEFMIIDLIAKLQAHTLLVTPSRLGCINETLLSMQALEFRDIDYDWCVNMHEEGDTFPKVTKPYYDSAFPGWWSIQEGLDRFVDKLLHE